MLVLIIFDFFTIMSAISPESGLLVISLNAGEDV